MNDRRGLEPDVPSATLSNGVLSLHECCVLQGWLNIDFAREVRLEKKLGEGGFGQVS